MKRFERNLFPDINTSKELREVLTFIESKIVR